MRRIPSLLTFILTIALVISCGNHNGGPEPLDCEVGPYKFTLGATVNEVMTTWPEITRDTMPESFFRNTQFYSQWYKDHTFQFYFFEGKLVRAEMVVPQEELSNASLIIDGESIAWDNSFAQPTEIQDPEYFFESSGVDTDHGRVATLGIEYPGATDRMSKK